MAITGQRTYPRPGLTSIEALAILAVVGAVAALVLPAVQSAREAARRARCAGNLKQAAMACQLYEAAHGCFPMGRNMRLHVADLPTIPPAYRIGWGLHAATLAYADHAPLHNAINFHLAPYQSSNSTVVGTLIDRLWCPSDAQVARLRRVIIGTGWDGTFGISYTSYGGIMGSFAFAGRGIEDRHAQLSAQGGMFPDVGLLNDLGGAGTRPPVRRGDVADGLAHVFLLGERAQGKLSRYNCGPQGHCDFLAHGWWASSDCGDAGLSAFYPPNLPGIARYGTHALGDPGSPTARCDGANPATVSVSSYHPGGANFAFADGSVRFVKDAIGSWGPAEAADGLDRNCVPAGAAMPGVYQALANIADGGLEPGEGY